MKKRKIFGEIGYRSPIPNLINFHQNSFEEFFNEDNITKVLSEVFPIINESYNIVVELKGIQIILPSITEEEAIIRDLNYSARIVVKVEIICQSLSKSYKFHIDEVPILTKEGSFIINGNRKQFVWNIKKSPGPFFAREKTSLYCKVIPFNGIVFSIEKSTLQNIIYFKLTQTKKITIISFFSSLTIDEMEEINRIFNINPEYQSETINKKSKNAKILVFLEIFCKKFYCSFVRGGINISVSDPEDLKNFTFHKNKDKNIFIEDDIIKVKTSDLASSFLTDGTYLSDKIIAEFIRESKELEILFFREKYYFIAKSLKGLSFNNFNDASNTEIFRSYLFNKNHYSFLLQGRDRFKELYYLNGINMEEALGLENSKSVCILPADIFLIFVTLIYHPHVTSDDLSSKNIKTISSTYTSIFRNSLKKMSKAFSSIMFTSTSYDDVIERSKSYLNNYFFSQEMNILFNNTQSPFVQLLEEVNALSIISHKRRITTSVPNKSRVGFEVRDVNQSYYGRLCPLETPEGPSIGLVNYLAVNAVVNSLGFIESTYIKIRDREIINGEKVFLTSQMEKEKKYKVIDSYTKIDSENKIELDADIIEPNDFHITSPIASLIPFGNHNDARRYLMGTNMQKQAVPLLFPDSPVVGTGFESIIISNTFPNLLAKKNSIVKYVDSTLLLLEGEDGKTEKINLKTFKKSNASTVIHQYPIVHCGQKLKKGDPIINTESFKDGEVALGKNLTVAFLSWYGYNFEDAMVISEKLLYDDALTSTHIVEFNIGIKDEEEFTNKIGEIDVSHLDKDGIVKEGIYIKPGMIIAGIIKPKNTDDEDLLSPEDKLFKNIFGSGIKDFKDVSFKSNIEGSVVSVHKISSDGFDNFIKEEDNKSKKLSDIYESFDKYSTENKNDIKIEKVESLSLANVYSRFIKIFVAVKKYINVGDKLSGRHGNKGVISRIEKIEEMPFLADGRTIDIILSPLGIPSRMNMGQVLETHLGLIHLHSGEKFEVPMFTLNSPLEIEELLKKYNLPQDGRVNLYNNDCQLLERRVTVGAQYIMKLNHIAEDKIHARATGPYSLINQQPTSGRAAKGGQRVGEMEVWAFVAHGARENLKELMFIRSDDITARVDSYLAMIEGREFYFDENNSLTESFNVMQKLLISCCINLVVK